MRSLPLYTDRRSAVEVATPLPPDNSCIRCGLCEQAKSVCISPAGAVDRDVLLVVGNYPTKLEDTSGVPFASDMATTLRAEITEQWNGDVVYTYGLRCAPGRRAVTDTMVNACRGYLTHLVNVVKPSRIVTLGAVAYAAVTGRRISPENIRGGYTQLSTGAFVFPLLALHTAAGNPFRYEHLLEDLEYALTANPTPPPWDAEYHVIETPGDAASAVEVLSQERSVTYDTEYSGPPHTSFFQVDTLAVCATGKEVAYVWDEKALANPECVKPFQKLMENPCIEKIGHNIKVDLTAVEEDERIAAKVRGPLGDTLIWCKLNDTDVLGRLAYQSELVGMGGHKEAMEQGLVAARKTIDQTRAEYESSHLALPGMLPRPLEGAIHYKGAEVDAFAYGLVSSSLRSQYCALDTVATSRLAVHFRHALAKRSNLTRAWTELLRPASATISQIERWGFRADRNQIANVGRFVDTEMAKLRPKLAAQGVDFKLTQDAALSKFLFQKLGLAIQDLTKTGNPSVASSVLEKLKSRHPVVPLIIEYKEFETISQRYAWGMMDHVRDDGRIHGHFNITGTKTGRFSSSNPNMQNIPSRSPVLAKMVKNIFVASPGWRLVQIDYSQLEYRVAAILSGDEVMQQVFIDGLDLHRRTAELISQDAWGIPQSVMEGYDSATIKPYRANSKQVNFGTLYGLGAGTLAADLGITRQKAERLIELIMGKFKVLAKWVAGQIRFCKQNGFVYTYFDGKPGRYRPLWNIADRDDSVQSGARNASINTPVQGSAAEYMLRSLNEVVQWFLVEQIPARVVGTVHDSMMLEIREDWVQDVTETVVGIMESWWSGAVPLVADVETGARWGEMAEVAKDSSDNLVWPT